CPAADTGRAAAEGAGLRPLLSGCTGRPRNDPYAPVLTHQDGSAALAAEESGAMIRSQKIRARVRAGLARTGVDTDSPVVQPRRDGDHRDSRAAGAAGRVRAEPMAPSPSVRCSARRCSTSLNTARSSSPTHSTAQVA